MCTLQISQKVEHVVHPLLIRISPFSSGLQARGFQRHYHNLSGERHSASSRSCQRSEKPRPLPGELQAFLKNSNSCTSVYFPCAPSASVFSVHCPLATSSSPRINA